MRATLSACRRGVEGRSPEPSGGKRGTCADDGINPTHIMLDQRSLARHHHHESLANFSLAEVHYGRHLELIGVRQKALGEAWIAHPERFVRGRSVARQVPGEVWINRPEQEPASNAPQVVAS